MKGVCTMLEDIKKILEKLKEMDASKLAHYDVKQEDTTLQDYFRKRSSIMGTPKTIDELSPWERMCCYRVSDDQQFDCDTALFSIVVYYLTYGLSENGWVIRKYSEKNSKFQLVTPKKEWLLRGDTMNSYATSVHSVIRKLWIPREGNKKRMIEAGILDEKGNVNSKLEKNYWEDVILSHYDYFRNVLPDSAHAYIQLNHTMGNLIPVPFISENKGQFNSPRGLGKSKDYWDLALLAVYKHYHPACSGFAYMQDPLKWLLGSASNVALCRNWLESFATWDTFVEQNFLQDFVNQQDGRFGLPKELWAGHFQQNISVLPEKEKDFDQLFTNAAAWITARGQRIAEKIHEVLEGRDLAALAEEMVDP